MRVKEESKKSELKFNIKKKEKPKIMVSGPSISWQIQGEKLEKGKILISCAPKSLYIMTAVMKWKDVCSLEGELWQT